MPYRHVMVGSDGSQTAHLAVAQAADLAKAFDARLTIVTAFTKDPSHRAADVPDELQWQVADAAEAEARADAGRRLALDRGCVNVHTSVSSGEPADVLLESARDLAADLIVLGSKGMRSPARFLVGSVPNSVSHHAPCDLVIVRTSD